MRMLLILLALGLAAGLTIYVKKEIDSAKIVETKVEQKILKEAVVGVLVANRDLAPGTLLRPADLAFQPYPEGAIREEYTTENKVRSVDEFVQPGLVVRDTIVKGEPLLSGKYVKPGDQGYMAAILRPGMKAVSIPVNERTGVSGFVYPGDYVDVVLTQMVTDTTVEVKGQGNTGVTRQMAETIVRSAKVIGTGQTTGKPEAGGAVLVNTVTLELTPKLSEIVTLANNLGTLQVVLNPLRDQDMSQMSEEEQTALKAKLETFPYQVEGVADGTYYTSTNDVEASPIRKRTYGVASDGSVSVYRFGTGKGK